MPVSLSGLDLSFLRKADPKACQPGRYALHNNQVLPAQLARRLRRAEAGDSKRSDLPTPYFMPDVDAAYGGAWKSIVDGSEISSRSNWKEHDKRNGVVNIGTDFWAKDGDDIRYTEEKMGYDPSLIGSPDFAWKDVPST